ncbi:unnamed protein product [Sphagnum jensenii]
MVDTVPLVFLSSGVIHLLHLLPRELTNRALNIQVNSSIKAFLRHMVRISPAVFFRLQLSGWDQCTICCCTAITPGIKWLLCPTRTLGTAVRATPVGATTTDTIGFGNGQQGYTQQGFGLQVYNGCGYQS